MPVLFSEGGRTFMDYELLHDVSLIDKEILKLERTKVDKTIVKELNAFKNKHKLLKELYEGELIKQRDLNLKTRNISQLIDNKTKEKLEHETNLYSTSNVKAIELCQGIIDKLNIEIKELEDEVYQIMNKNETLTEDNSKLVVEVNEIRASYNSILKKYKKSQDDFTKKINTLIDKRNKSIKNVSPEVKKLYEEIKQERGFGMSEVKGEICTGCNVGVPIVIIDEVKNSKKLIKCPNCNRLLYIADIEI